MYVFTAMHFWNVVDIILHNVQSSKVPKIVENFQWLLVAKLLLLLFDEIVWNIYNALVCVLLAHPKLLKTVAAAK